MFFYFRKSDYSNIDHLFRDKFPSFEDSPPDHIWENIKHKVYSQDPLKKAFSIRDFYESFFNFLFINDKMFREVKKASNIALPVSNTIKVDEVIESIESLSPELIFHLKKNNCDLIKIKPNVFEHLIAEFLFNKGFCDVRCIGNDQKTSADIFAIDFIESINEKLKFFIEIKRTSDKIGINVINQVIGAVTIERPLIGWDVAMIVSLNGYRDFRKIDKNKISNMGLKLKDKNDVLTWLDDYEPNPNGLYLPKPKTNIDDIINN